jgi:hypothetical protein
MIGEEFIARSSMVYRLSIKHPDYTSLKVLFVCSRIASSTFRPRSNDQQRILVLFTDHDLPLPTFSVSLCLQLGFQLVFQHGPQKASFRVRVMAEDDMGASLGGRQRLVLHSYSTMSKVHDFQHELGKDRRVL